MSGPRGVGDPTRDPAEGVRLRCAPADLRDQVVGSVVGPGRGRRACPRPGPTPSSGPSESRTTGAQRRRTKGARSKVERSKQGRRTDRHNKATQATRRRGQERTGKTRRATRRRTRQAKKTGELEAGGGHERAPCGRARRGGRRARRVGRRRRPAVRCIVDCGRRTGMGCTGWSPEAVPWGWRRSVRPPASGLHSGCVWDGHCSRIRVPGCVTSPSRRAPSGVAVLALVVPDTTTTSNASSVTRGRRHALERAVACRGVPWRAVACRRVSVSSNTLVGERLERSPTAAASR